MKTWVRSSFLVLAVSALALSTSAWADSTSATSSGTAVTVNVVAPIAINCDATFTINNALASGTGPRSTSPKAFNCELITAGITPDSDGVVLSAISTDLIHGSDVIPASDISLSSTSGGTYTAMNADNLTYAAFLTESTATSPQAVYAKVNIPQNQAAGSYTGTITVALDVTFTP